MNESSCEMILNCVGEMHTDNEQTEKEEKINQAASGRELQEEP